MSSSRFAVALAALGLSAFVVSAQQTPSPQLPPIPPARGSLAVSPDDAAAIAKALKAPAGFTITPFATPPIVNYPTCVTATHDGVVFVCVDRNGSLQADTGMGYVLRLVDKDQNGQADEYSVFATMDSPRGAVFDGETLFVMHPPFLTAFRDANGDGVAEERKTLIRGLGFDLTFRGADHTTNGMEQGIDGWLYIAVGDYGFVKAVGVDGREIQMRGGGNVRVRPDGTELEIYSRGTRNDYDVAVDPYLNLFARGNTNDGGGFDIRLYHFVSGATFGYPTLFRNFSDEVVPPLADYGTGSGTGMLYVAEGSVPGPFGDALYSVDYGRNMIYRHPLQPKGATFAVQEESFLSVPRPTDMTVDGSGRLYASSWSGGGFRYSTDRVGYIARLTHDGAKPTAVIDLNAAEDARLVEVIGGTSLVQARAAQAVLLRRGTSTVRLSLLERKAQTGALQGRVAALFTLKQLGGASAATALVNLAKDATMRPFALRALADRPGELTNVPQSIFVDALKDPDPRVQLQAITGLRRLGATSAAAALLPLTANPDIVISNVAVNTLVALDAVEAPLAAVTGPSEPIAAGALRVLQQLHRPSVVNGLIAALPDTNDVRRARVLQALARLHYREGVWRGTIGEWWGTRPDTTGPYYDPVAWTESTRIKAVLLGELLQDPAAGAARTDGKQLTTDLERNRLLTSGGAELLNALAGSRADFNQAARLLVGNVRLDVDTAAGQLLTRLSAVSPVVRASVVKLAVAAGPPTPASGVILLSAATDSKLDTALRVSALNSLASATGLDGLSRAIEAFATLATDNTLDEALDSAWTQFIGMPGHAANVAQFQTLAASAAPTRQRLGYAVLLRLAADPPAVAGRGAAGGRGRGRGPTPEVIDAARGQARKTLEAAWNGPTAVSAVWAVGRTAAVTYRDRVTALQTSTDPRVREGVALALERLAAAAPATAAPAPGAGPLVSAVPFEEVATRLASMTGDVAAGRALFTRQACSACHTSQANEPEKGPYLGGIFTRYSRAEVIESILRPSAKVAQGFATNAFTMIDGRLLSGFVIREGQNEVVIRDLAGVETILQKAAIANRNVSEGSMMPAGLANNMTVQELASLLAFLQSTTAK